MGCLLCDGCLQSLGWGQGLKVCLGSGLNLGKSWEVDGSAYVGEGAGERASEILDETDERLWRVLRAYVAEARERLDNVCVTRVEGWTR